MLHFDNTIKRISLGEIELRHRNTHFTDFTYKADDDDDDYYYYYDDYDDDYDDDGDVN